jgi:DNA-binding NtrC family response regulator
MRVGGTGTVKVDVRIVAATNANLERDVAEGRFRSDLYYRLKVLMVRLPALRERKEDIPPLIEHYLDRFSGENERPRLELTPAALRCLVDNPWSGNVRELRNLLESLVVLATGTVVDIGDLPPEYRLPSGGSPALAPQPAAAFAGSGFAPSAQGTGMGDAGVVSMDEVERRAILQALQETNGNRTQAAEKLGIGLRTLQRKLKEYRARGFLSE